MLVSGYYKNHLLHLSGIVVFYSQKLKASSVTSGPHTLTAIQSRYRLTYVYLVEKKKGAMFVVKLLENLSGSVVNQNNL